MNRIWYCQGNFTGKTNVETVSARTHKICGCTELILKGYLSVMCENTLENVVLSQKKPHVTGTTMKQTLHFQNFSLRAKTTRIQSDKRCSSDHAKNVQEFLFSGCLTGLRFGFLLVLLSIYNRLGICTVRKLDRVDLHIVNLKYNNC